MALELHKKNSVITIPEAEQFFFTPVNKIYGESVFCVIGSWKPFTTSFTQSGTIYDDVDLLAWLRTPILIYFEKTGAFSKTFDMYCYGMEPIGDYKPYIKVWMSNVNGKEGSSKTFSLEGKTDEQLHLTWSDSGTYNYMNCSVTFRYFERSNRIASTGATSVTDSKNKTITVGSQMNGGSATKWTVKKVGFLTTTSFLSGTLIDRNVEINGTITREENRFFGSVRAAYSGMKYNESQVRLFLNITIRKPESYLHLDVNGNYYYEASSYTYIRKYNLTNNTLALPDGSTNGKFDIKVPMEYVSIPIGYFPYESYGSYETIESASLEVLVNGKSYTQSLAIGTNTINTTKSFPFIE